jgi:excisionase family DNA binding protein
MTVLLSVKQVSERLQISRSLVYREMQNGNLPFHRFGRRTYRISEEDVAAYANAAKSHASSEAAKPSVPTTEAPPKQTKFRHIDVTRLLS